MYGKTFQIFCSSFLLFLSSISAAHAQGERALSPLEFLRGQELHHKDKRCVIHLGKVMTLLYAPASVETDHGFHPFLLELTDVLKTPMRAGYRLVLKGYTDNEGPARMNLELSRRRAETLKRRLIGQYRLEASRITAEGFGEENPAATNETPEGRALNRRVDIIVYGDVSEAVRYVGEGIGQGRSKGSRENSSLKRDSHGP